MRGGGKGGKEGEILNGPTTSPVWPGGLRTTRTVRLNAENVADVQKAVLEIYGARGTVYATKVASFKES